LIIIHTGINNDNKVKDYIKLASFITQFTKTIKTTINIKITPHYSYSTFDSITHYAYKDYNKDIAEAYESSFIENIQNMTEFIQEQHAYDECEILSPTDTAFLFKGDKDGNIASKISYNNINIKNGLCSHKDNMFRSLDKILFRYYIY
jgi:hypothetical protein